MSPAMTEPGSADAFWLHKEDLRTGYKWPALHGHGSWSHDVCHPLCTAVTITNALPSPHAAWGRGIVLPCRRWNLHGCSRYIFTKWRGERCYL